MATDCVGMVRFSYPEGSSSLTSHFLKANQLIWMLEEGNRFQFFPYMPYLTICLVKESHHVVWCCI